MTREEALGEKGDRSLEDGGINQLVRDIYDDFESRTCSNCKFLTKDEKCYTLEDFIYPDYYVLDDSGFYIEGYDVEKPKNFGCNRWEPKESHES